MSTEMSSQSNILHDLPDMFKSIIKPVSHFNKIHFEIAEKPSCIKNEEVEATPSINTSESSSNMIDGIDELSKIMRKP